MKFWRKQFPVLALLALAVLVFEAGCVGFIPAHFSLGTLLPGDVKEIQPISKTPRIGQVILLRGFVGIWSYGMDEIGKKLNDAGIHATVFPHVQWWFIASYIAKTYGTGPHPEPLVIIGHSLGADDAVSLARYLKQKNIPVDLLITVDPVAAPPVPDNVRLAINYYQAGGFGDIFPKLSIRLSREEGNPMKGASTETGKTPQLGVNQPNTVLNINLAKERPDLREPFMDHFNMDEGPKLHQEILQHLLKLCPPRSAKASSGKPSY